MRLNWKRYLKTSWGQRIFSLFLPFTVLPSDFVQHKVHPVYGKMSGIPFAPLLPACFIFVTAYVMIVNAETQLLANDIWHGKPPSEIISTNQEALTVIHSVVFIVILFSIYGVSLMKCFWHFVVRKITDKTRKDGKIAGSTPVQFSIFHTSGVASWLGVIMLVFAITNTFFPGHPFTIMDKFVNENLMWATALSAIALTFFVKYYQHNTKILMNIYKDENLVTRVRQISFIIPIGLVVSLQIAAVVTVLWLNTTQHL